MQGGENNSETPREPSQKVISESPFESILDDSSSDEEAVQEQNVSQSSGAHPQPGATTTSSSSTRRRKSNIYDENIDEVILSIIWLRGRVGAAYYNISTSLLYVMDDVIEDEFNHCITKKLYRQCQPRYVITTSGSPEPSLNVIKKLIVKETMDDTSSSSTDMNYAADVALKVVSKKANSFDDCLHRVNCLKLDSEPPDINNADRIMYLNSIINYNSKLMIHALGMLLKYIDINWGKLALDPNGEAKYLYVNCIQLKNLVMIEEETYKELNIMQTKFHPSLLKFGTSVKHEGMNLFTLLNRCQSRVGVQYMWKLMQQPTRDIKILNDRFRVTEFFLNPDNTNILESLRSGLKKIFRLTPVILDRYATPLAKPQDWVRLSSTLSNIIHIGELCSSCRRAADIFGKVADSVTRNMHHSRYFLDYIIDHDMSKHMGKFTVKPNVDSELDELNRIRHSLPEILSEYLEKDQDNLPDSVSTARMIYLPSLGFLLAITESPERPSRDVEIPKMDFRCTINGVRHYKSPAALELDEKLGDINQRITHRQSEILIRLVQFISEDIGPITKAIECCAELDALISLAIVAHDHNYVKPEMVKSHLIEIKDGRHPLRELFNEYVPNDTYSGDGHSLVKIFTGPNASGKTVYMKQVALIVYMAHIGCYVPATSAKIAVITNILTQIPSIETTCSNASSFLIDLRKVNTILYSSTPNSLIIMDEFGRGTAENDGLALMTSVLKNFIERGEHCPHIFVATHMHRVNNLLTPNLIFELKTLEFVLNDKNDLVFLYKIIPGNFTKSFAHEVAKSTGLSRHIIEEAERVFEYMKKGELPPTSPSEDGRKGIKCVTKVSEDKENVGPKILRYYIKQAINRKS